MVALQALLPALSLHALRLQMQRHSCTVALALRLPAAQQRTMRALDVLICGCYLHTANSQAACSIGYLAPAGISKVSQCSPCCSNATNYSDCLV